MKTSSAIAFLAAATTMAFSSSPSIPGFKDLWDTAEVVISSSAVEIITHDYQGELPEDWEFEYQRVHLKFFVDDVVKGSLNDNSEYFSTVYYTAKKKSNPVNSNKEFRMWGSAPYLSPIDEGSGEKYLVFLRRDVFGRLRPVHNLYYLLKISRGYEMQF